MPAAQATVNSGSPQPLTATIASGASLSDAQKVDGKLVGLQIPAAWTAAAITFSVSQDGTTYMDMWNTSLGTAVEVTVASAGIPTASTRFLALNLSDFVGVNFVKIRSGTSAAAVNQAASRSIGLVLAG
jgi:hypothetical protein